MVFKQGVARSNCTCSFSVDSYWSGFKGLASHSFLNIFICANSFAENKFNPPNGIVGNLRFHMVFPEVGVSLQLPYLSANQNHSTGD